MKSCGNRARLGRPPAVRFGFVPRVARHGGIGYGARVLLDAASLTSLGLAKPLMIVVSFAQLSPCGLGFRLCAGLGRVEGLLVCLQDARRQPSQKTTVNQAIAEFRRAPGYGCLNMGGCRVQQMAEPAS